MYCWILRFSLYEEGKSMHNRDIDPDLERQLDAAKEDEPVEAVLLLKDAEGDKPPIDVEALMKRVCGKGADEDVEMNYLPRVGALIVRARSRVLRLLISQPEVEMASANRIEGDTGL
jgi:hypothetical protein